MKLFYGKPFIPKKKRYQLVSLLNVELLVDEKKISLNDFVSRMLGGAIEGAVISLRGIDENWKTIEIILSR